MKPLELARTLVEIPSPTGEEGAAAAYVADLLARLGYDVQRQDVSADRFNVFATRDRPLVVLSTHLDTVPGRLPVREDATWLHGRGSADAKGIVAAQIVAAEALARRGEHRIGLLYVVGEETLSDGARAAAHLEPKGRYIINGEPTENRLALGTKGSIRMAVEARGAAAHSAYPEEGESAIERMLSALERVRRLRFPSDRRLGAVTLNIGTIHGGTRANVIPDSCRAELMFRTVADNGAVITETRRALGDVVDLRVTLEMPPVHLDPIPGFETTVVRYGTDLPLLEPWGKRYLMGPGSIHVAHTDHERVAKQELLDAVSLYIRLVEELLMEASA